MTKLSSSNFSEWTGKKYRTLRSSKFWERRLPIIKFLRGYNVKALTNDVIAGFTVALTVIPQCIAIATLAGVPPQYGLYSSFMSGFIYAILGPTIHSTIGPTVVMSILTRPFTDKFGPDIAILLCFLSGCCVTVVALLNLEFIVDFVSAPVLAGFMSAAGLSVISGQLPGLLGIKGGGETFLEYWINIINNIEYIKLWDSLLGVSCIIVLFALDYIYKFSEIPNDGRQTISKKEKFLRGVLRYLSLGRNAIVVIISTAIVASLTSSGGEPPVGVPADIKEGLPEFKPPPFEVIKGNTTLTFAEAALELLPALTVPILALLETISTCKLFESDVTIDFTQEMFTVGICNILSSFVQSIPVAPSMTRSAVNKKSGVQTTLGGIVTGSVVLLCLALFTSTLQYLPNATMAAVIIVAVYIIIQIHSNTMHLWKSNCKSDLIPLYVTFIASLVIGLDYGMIIGIIFNMIFILKRAARPKIDINSFNFGDKLILVMTPDRAVTYPAAENVKKIVKKHTAKVNSNLIIVLDGLKIQTIDFTAIRAFRSMLIEAKKREEDIVFWNWKPSLQDKLQRYDTSDALLFVGGADLKEELRLGLKMTPSKLIVN